jgi:hypothetical protein
VAQSTIGMPSRTFYISRGPGRVVQMIDVKQRGKCRFCGSEFDIHEQIVSNGRRKKYYHRECAWKLNIITSPVEEDQQIVDL